MGESRKSQLLASRLTHSWEAHVEAAKIYNGELDAGNKLPGRLQQFWWKFQYGNDQGKLKERQSIWFQKARRIPSLTFSLNNTFGRQFWVSGMMVFKGIDEVLY